MSDTESDYDEDATVTDREVQKLLFFGSLFCFCFALRLVRTQINILQESSSSDGDVDFKEASVDKVLLSITNTQTNSQKHLLQKHKPKTRSY